MLVRMVVVALGIRQRCKRPVASRKDAGGGRKRGTTSGRREAAEMEEDTSGARPQRAGSACTGRGGAAARGPAVGVVAKERSSDPAGGDGEQDASGICMKMAMMVGCRDVDADGGGARLSRWCANYHS